MLKHKSFLNQTETVIFWSPSRSKSLIFLHLEKKESMNQSLTRDTKIFIYFVFHLKWIIEFKSNPESTYNIANQRHSNEILLSPM